LLDSKNIRHYAYVERCVTKDKVKKQDSVKNTDSSHRTAQPETLNRGKCGKRSKSGIVYILLLIVIFGCSVTPAGSQALNCAHSLADIEIRSKGVYENVLLMPAEFESEKWYYTTSNLHFGKREIAGKEVPEMTLLRYQRPDLNNPNRYIEGATLQLAVDVDPLDDAARRRLLSKAKSAAESWESTHYQKFLAKLQQEAAKTGSAQERWKVLSNDFSNARKKDIAARNSKNMDAVLAQALTDGLEDWVITGLEESGRLLRMRNPVSLEPFPMASAQVSLFDGLGKAVHTVGPTRGVAPEYATDRLGFTLELGKNAVDVSEALLTSQTGIFMILRREYEVISAPLAYKIFIDYDKAWREYRKNADILSKAVLFAGYQVLESAEAEKKKIVEWFERDILRAFDSNDNPVPLASIDTKTLQALVGRINRGILQDEWAPESVDLRSFKSPQKMQPFDPEDLSLPSVRDSGSAPKEKTDKPVVYPDLRAPGSPALGGTETLLPGYRYRERKSVVTHGFLSISGYDESIIKQLIIDEPTPEWQNAYFLLPGVGDDPQIGVRRVVTKVALQIKGRDWREQTATWEIGEGWMLAGGQKPKAWGIISFPLAEARRQFGESALQDSEFSIDQEMRCALGKIYTLSSTYSVKAFDGRGMIAAPLECIQPVIFDFTNFRWNAPEQALYSSQVTLTQRLGSGRPMRMQRNVFPGRELMVMPMGIDPMGELDVGVISAKIGFDARYRDEQGRPRRKALWWNLNNENLADLYPALFVSIFNGEWEE